MVTYISIGSYPRFKTVEVFVTTYIRRQEKSNAQWGVLAACFLRRVVEEGRDWLD